MRFLFLALVLLPRLCLTAPATTAVILNPQQLPEAADHRIETLSLMAWSGDRFEPIPFQIDELDEKGMVWFSSTGFELVGRPGLFDGSDQVLFMQEDAGPRAPADRQPEHGSALAEIELAPQRGEPAYVYLVENNPARSLTRYIEHDPDKGVTRTPYYFLTTDPQNELNWEYLGYQGYRGPPDASIIDTLKMRMSGGLLVRYPRVTLDNDNLQPRRTGFSIGPIRSVMHLETSVVFAGLPVMKLHVQAYRFPNHYEAHSFARIPGLYRRTVRYPQVAVSVDGNNLLGSRIWTAAGGELHGTVDGHMDKQEEELVKRQLSTENSWILFDSGREFALLTELAIPPDLEGIPLQLVYQDDAELQVRPEQYVGQLPNLGYALNGWPEQDELRFAVRLLFFSNLSGQPAEQVAALRSGRTLSITSRPLSP